MRGPGKKTIERREAIIEIIEEIQPATIRAVCYKLLVRRLLNNMSKSQTNVVSGQLVDLREKEDVDWAAIVDETREIEVTKCYPSLEAHFEKFCKEHALDPWLDQPERVVVVSEKGTIRGTLQPVLDELKVPTLICHGYGSATVVHDLAEMSQDHDRPWQVLYIGDHDPSGMQMSEVDLPERLVRRYGGNANISRIAITDDDKTRLPRNPISADSENPNRPWYVRLYGNEYCELDAMDPNDLRTRVRESILAHVDPEAWERSMDQEAEQIDRLADRKDQIITILNGG